MSALRAPGLGPVIGHTTSTTCRLWIRADDPEDEGAYLASDRRSVGVIGVVGANGQIGDAYYFRLQREFDRTGTFVLGEDVALGRHDSDRLPGEPASAVDQAKPLRANTLYTVRMATLTLDDPLPDDESLEDRELARRLPPIENIKQMLLKLPAEKSEARLRTFPGGNRPADKLSFLLGSCRYPGFLWKVKDADRIFGHMQPKIGTDDPDKARFTLMVGDQIYADLLNKALPLLRADSYEEFQSRYREALGSPNMRRLLRASPVYMILDDHEIEDNWTQDEINRPGKEHLFNIAIGAYMSYQWSHGPRTWGRRLYYDFACAGYPFFVLDTRTQRFKDDAIGLADNHLLGRPTIDPVHPGQLQRLLEWLSAQPKAAPKFIASASVFAPNGMTERVEANDNVTFHEVLEDANQRRRNRSDSWPAYPNTRKRILDHIVENKIQNVVFLTGDIHCANIARMEFEIGGDDSGLVAYDITSSAFYWPFPFADGDPNNYVHDSRDTDQRDPFPVSGGIMHYRAWAFTQEDNFCQITIDKPAQELRVEYFDRQGQPLEVTAINPDTNRMVRRAKVNRLKLARW